MVMAVTRALSTKMEDISGIGQQLIAKEKGG